jgi:glycine cleavage system T protein
VIPRKADVVIVGAGIVGCSLAYELTRAGVRDVLVLDQGPLEHTGGSSFHAPGLVFQTGPSRLLCELAQHSVAAYRALHDPERPTWLEVGSVEVAVEPARVRELQRRRNHAEAYGVAGKVLEPAKVTELIPLVPEDAILAGYHVPTDGLCKAATVCHVLRARSEALGARFLGLTRVAGVKRSGGRVRAVETAAGSVATGTVAICGGLWGPELQELIGRPIPMQPMQHLFAWTNPLPALREAAGEAEHPILRHQDRDLYYRQRGDGYGIGSYDHEPLPIDVPQLEREHYGHQVAHGPFTPEHFQSALESTAALLPDVHAAGLAETFNGHFAFTIDGYPLLGPSSFVDGLYLAEALWVTHAAGGARAVADLIVGREPALDVSGAHPDRFQAHHSAPAYVRARGMQLYAEVYDVLHPAQPLLHPRGLRTTPYHERFVELGGELTESAGWERPLWFTSNARLPEPPHRQTRDDWSAMFWSETQEREHHATRTAAGLFDLTPFTKLEVEGPGACDWLNRVCASELDRPVGRIVYTTVLTPAGGIVCDLTVTRLAEDRYLVVTGGASGQRDAAWLRALLPAGGTVALRDVSSGLAVLGLWGPRARDVLRPLASVDLGNEAFPYMSARPLHIEHAPALALRISYAGELGWELYVPTEYGRWVWDRLLEAGREHDLAPCGTAAFESLRIEKGYRFAGVDMQRDHTPDEAGVGFTVHMTKPDFVGRAGVAAARERGPRRRLAPIVLDDPNAAPLGGEAVRVGGVAVGRVTSAAFGPSVGESIAYAWLPPEAAEPGQRAAVRVLDRFVGGVVASEPRWDPQGIRLRG